MSINRLKFNASDKRHPLYNTWWNMVARCYVHAAPGFENYGGRGISVCDEWLEFFTFVKDMLPTRKAGETLDRINNDSGYSPSNCKWSSRSEQMLNRRTFGNNKTGFTGIIAIANRFEARLDYAGERYRIGRFDSVEAAKLARDEFTNLFFTDKDSAIKSIQVETVWTTSSTNMRGITKHADGGFIVRVTKNKKRVYVGYFKTIEDAINAKCEFNS